MTNSPNPSVAASAATESDTHARPNILIILVDQLRFPRYAYGPQAGFAPDLKDVVGFQGESDAENTYRHYFPGLWSLRKHSVV
ncbi:hypothetical protein, partial [Streptomyces sp. NPDC050619]